METSSLYSPPPVTGNQASRSLFIEAALSVDELVLFALTRNSTFQCREGHRHTQRSANNGNDLVRQSQALVKLFARSQHVLKRLPALFRVSDDELLDLLKLVDTEDAPRVFAVRTGFFTEVGGVAGVLDGEVGGA